LLAELMHSAVALCCRWREQDEPEEAPEEETRDDL
jgi:hypothetical protein